MASRFLILALAFLFAQSNAELKPESELTHSCFGFPGKSFHRTNNVKKLYGSSPHTAGGHEVGEFAYDFTLNDLDGNEINLAKLLVKKPVLLVWGMWTCPAFQGLGSESGTNDKFSKCSYMDEWNLVEKVSDKVTVVHLVGPEPHPITPDTNFDEGTFRMNYWSTVRQPKTFEDRLVIAEKVREYIHPSAHLLVDKLSSESGEPNQGVWCTMGLGARTSILINQNGKIVYKEDWFNADATSDAIDTYLQ
jgi:peroxiredoxin